MELGGGGVVYKFLSFCLTIFELYVYDKVDFINIPI